MENPTSLYARLSKDGNRVLCARKNCGGVLGTVNVDMVKGSQVLEPPSGWYKQQGIYELTRHARRASSFPTAMARMKPDYEPTLRRHPDKTWQSPFTEYGSHPSLPCRARCPRCDRTQFLDPERLGCEPDPMQPWNSANLDTLENNMVGWSNPIGDQGDLIISTPPFPGSGITIHPDDR